MSEHSNEARITHLINIIWKLEKRMIKLEEWIKDLDDRFSAHENREEVK